MPSASARTAHTQNRVVVVLGEVRRELAADAGQAHAAELGAERERLELEALLAEVRDLVALRRAEPRVHRLVVVAGDARARVRAEVAADVRASVERQRREELQHLDRAGGDDDAAARVHRHRAVLLPVSESQRRPFTPTARPCFTRKPVARHVA